MTWTIHTHREYDPKQSRRSSRESTGRVYYPEAFRRLVAATPPESKRDRDAQLGWLAVIVVVIAAISLALVANL